MHLRALQCHALGSRGRFHRHGLRPRRRPCSTPSLRRHLRPSGAAHNLPSHSRGQEFQRRTSGRNIALSMASAGVTALTATPLDSPCFLFAARPTPPQHPAPPRMAPYATSATSTSRCPAATARWPACRSCLHAGLPHEGDTNNLDAYMRWVDCKP